MIRAENISRYFELKRKNGIIEKTEALNSLSLSITKGKIVTIIGASGCGKSTFLEILAGQHNPDSGELHIDGKRVYDSNKKKSKFLSQLSNGLFRNRQKYDIGMIFQDYAVFPWMSAVENIEFVLKLQKKDKKERREIAEKYLTQVGLQNSFHKYPSQLSGGMKQRVALARALAVNPKIIFMDEPFAAVDSFTREKLQDDLLEIWENTGITIVMVTHDIEEAVYLSDEIVLFSESPGRIKEIYKIDIPRPRVRGDKEILKLEKEIKSHFN